MRRFAAVALREIAERRFVLVAAAFAAAIPLLIPMLPSVPADQAIAARGIAALAIAFTFGVGGSLLVGASVVGRELAEKRLSFHFSRPIPGPVIWAGKLLGGLAVVLFAEAIVILPTAAAIGGMPSFGSATADPEFVRELLFVSVPFFLLAWIGSVSLRSRSLWLALDAVLLVGLPALLLVVGRRFLHYGGRVDPFRALFIALGVLLCALLLATFAQVVAGRTDTRRGHGAQSLALWGLILAATAAGAVWAERTIDPGVDRLVHAWAQPAGSGGQWVFVQGSARENGRGSSHYLVNLSTGRSLLLPFGWTAGVSSDGSRAAFVTASPLSSAKAVLETIGLTGGESTLLDLAEWPDGVALTADGRRLAVISQGTCSVLELPSLRSLAAARVPSVGWAYEPYFVSPDLVRLHPRRSWRRRAETAPSPAIALADPPVVELSVARKSVTTLATYPISSIPLAPRRAQGLDSGPIFHLVPSKDLSRVLAIGFGSAHAVRLLDAASGRVLASIDGSEEAGHPLGIFLADGRAVVAEPIRGGRRLVLFTPDGTRTSEIPLPAGTRHVRFGYEPAKGQLAVGLAREASNEKRDWSLVDLSSGQLRPLAAEPLQRVFWSDGLSIPAPGAPATRLARAKEGGRLVLYDPATGAQTPITRGAPRGK
jgi:hypothetical protein